MDLSPKEEPTVDLLAAWHSGDRAAFDRLLSRCRRVVLSHIADTARLAVGPEADADDIFQAISFLAWQKLDDFEYRFKGGLAAWLCALADGVVADRVKYRHANGRDKIVGFGTDDASRPGKLDFPAPVTSPSGAAMKREDRKRLQDLIDRLPDDERDLLRSKFIDGLSVRDIAAASGLSKSEVQRRLESGVARLRKWF